MPTPKAGYRLKDGTKVPGTTTIISRFKESGALIVWAYNQGKAGVELYASRDKAGEIGTVVHDMVERFIANDTPMDALKALSLEDDIQAAMSAYDSFLEWWDNSKMQVESQEIQMVSEIYRFGGTPDAIAIDGKGRRVLLDWKTSSSGVFVDYLLQLGAYRILWNENNPDKTLTGGCHLCVFKKSNGDFAHHYYPNLDEAEKAFLLMRELYALDQSLKKRV